MMTTLRTQIPNYSPYQVLYSSPATTVFEARRHRDAARVGLKVSHATSTDAAARFLRWARATRDLPHRSFVRVFDYGRADDLPWCAMELLDGAPLPVLLNSRTVGAREQLQILREVARALCFCHERGVVHGRLGLSSVFVETVGRVRLLDVGWTSPETLEPREDIIGFARLGRDLLRRAHGQRDPDSAPPLRESPLPMTGLTNRIAGILERCAQDERDERLTSMHAVSEALDDFALDLEVELQIETPVWMPALQGRA